MAEKRRYRGRFAQTGIYLGKLFRMFVYQNDWKMLPMAALIGGLVTFAVGTNVFVTQEGTMNGCFSLACVCVWNGCFNSIQVICRERPIIKREHRSGAHISSYIAAHMIYQAVLCIAQTAIILTICGFAGFKFPKEGLVTSYFLLDFAISMFLITYAADMLSLAISAIVKNTTAAMTVMPFVMMFQLLFSGTLILLNGPAANIPNFTITKWGLQSLCALGDYNSQPMVSMWNMIWKFRGYEIEGQKPIEMITDYIRKNGLRDQFLQETGAYSAVEAYAHTADNVILCWLVLLFMIMLFAIVAVAVLEQIDRDKR